tara:strand:+ start:218509 stop:219186 length:678 start_codon:yes stop_codon:yes gene_type:complete
MIDFKELKKWISIEEVVHDFLGLETTPTKTSLKVDCPVCESKHCQNLVITPRPNSGLHKNHPARIKLEEMEAAGIDPTVWICLSAKKGGDSIYCGDLISLVAHIKKVSIKEASILLAEEYMSSMKSSRPTNKKDEPKKETAEKVKEKVSFDPDNYAKKLDSSPEALASLGLTPDLCEEVGQMGMCSKGINRGKLVFPLRTDTGEFITYIGAGEVTIPVKYRCENG